MVALTWIGSASESLEKCYINVQLQLEAGVKLVVMVMLCAELAMPCNPRDSCLLVRISANKYKTHLKMINAGNGPSLYVDQHL